MCFGLRFVILHFDPKRNVIHLRSFYDALAGGDVTKMESIFDASLHSANCTMLQQLVSLPGNMPIFTVCSNSNMSICTSLYYRLCSNLVPFTLVAITLRYANVLILLMGKIEVECKSITNGA